jgi:hypothetical protein
MTSFSGPTGKTGKSGKLSVIFQPFRNRKKRKVWKGFFRTFPFFPFSVRGQGFSPLPLYRPRARQDAVNDEGRQLCLRLWPSERFLSRTSACDHRICSVACRMHVALSNRRYAKALSAAQPSQRSTRISRLPSRPLAESRVALKGAKLASRSGVPGLTRAG